MTYTIIQSLIAATNEPGAPVDGSTGSDLNLPEVTADVATVRGALAIVFGVIALVAVIYIIIAGFQFVTSQGDPSQVAKARQTILFAVIGLVVAVSAEVIIMFVLGRL